MKMSGLLHGGLTTILLLALWGLECKQVSAQQPKEFVIVALGDSITKGVRPGVQAAETFAALLQTQLKSDRSAVRVVNVGIGGERTDQALQRLPKVLARRPRFVLLMYGTNDSYVDRDKKDSRLSAQQYGENLEKLLTQIRQAGCQPILMTPPRWGDRARRNGAGEHPNVRLEKYVQVCREVAQRTKTPLVDHFAHWSKQAEAGVDIGAWTTDQCHPNPRGHRELANVILPVLRKELARRQ